MMSTICVFLSAIVFLLLVADTNATNQCTNGTLSKTDVELFLSKANEARTKVREGKQLNGLSGSYLPPAMNMDNLTWDCKLETDSAAVLDYFCRLNRNNNATPPFNYSTVLASAGFRDVHIAQTLSNLVNEIEYNNLTRIDGLKVYYNNETALETFANVIRQNTSIIGCSKLACPYQVSGTNTNVTEYFTVCLANQFLIKPGQLIYEGYEATTTTESTTTSTPASLAVLPSGTNSKCSSNNGVTDEVRYKFLSMHNYRRILLAQGKVTRKNGNAYPKAANMARMNYDCNLEADALAYVKQCPRVKSGVANAGENYFRISTNGINSWVGGVNKAVTSWWKVVRESSSGVGVSAVAFRQNHVGTAIESWSQMAWAKTNKIGCAIGICSGEYVAVCRYTEKGNVVGQQVYTPGRLCSMCTNGCNQNGLCL